MVLPHVQSMTVYEAKNHFGIHVGKCINLIAYLARIPETFPHAASISLRISTKVTPTTVSVTLGEILRVGKIRVGQASVL